MPALRLFSYFIRVIIPVFVASAVSLWAAEGIQEIDLPLRGLVYDPGTQKLYGTTGTNLIQIDPGSGEIQARHAIGNTPSRVQLSAGGGLWVGLDGDGAVVRFDLTTKSAGEAIVVQPGGTIRDIAPFAADPFTLTVVARGPDQTDKAHAIRNAQLLPETFPMSTATMSGNTVYGQIWGRLYKLELGANGLSLSLTATGVALGDPEVFDGVLYHPQGHIFRASDFLYQTTLLGHGVNGGLNNSDAVAINKEMDQLFYLANDNDFALHRFNRTNRVHTGLARFGPSDPAAEFLDLQSWGTNRVAFHTRTKLYLVEVDKLFLPADLEVSQSSIAPTVSFGTNVTVTITVTNRGPGIATQVTLENFIETNERGERIHILRALNGTPSEPSAFDSPIRTTIAPIAAGGSETLSITYLPRTPGIFTNLVSVSANNESNSADNTNTFSFPLDPPQNGLVRIPGSFVDIVFDPVAKRLWAHDGVELWNFDAETPKIFDPNNAFVGAERIAVAPQSGAVYLGNYIYPPDPHRDIRVTSRFPAGPEPIFAIGALTDLEVSPIDPDLIALSRGDGTTLFKNGAPLPSKVAASGFIAFSPDGTKLYRSNADNCDLFVYAVSDSGITFERSFPGVGCGEFVAANGVLYLDNGAIIDPATGMRVPNTPIVQPPAVAIPATGGGFELVHRVNGVWVVKRYRAAGTGDFENFAERQFTGFGGPVLEALALGSERMAINSGSELLIVDLPGDTNTVQISVSRVAGETVLRFASSAGAQYRIERSDRLGTDAAWTRPFDAIVGTGSIVSVPIPMPNEMAFYRVVRL